jgi:hypothetical protein
MEGTGQVIAVFNPDDWKRSVALVILWAYGYQLCLWPLMFWFTAVLTMWTGFQWPAPPLMPWEHLATGTGTLGMIGGIQAWRDKIEVSIAQEHK